MLTETIDTDLKTAMKEKNTIKVATLRMLKAAIINKLIEKKAKELTDEDIREIIQKQVKQRKEAIEEFKKGARQDLVEKETKELTILERYLPSQLTEAELKSLISSVIESTAAKSKSDMGKVMKELMPRVKGRADGKEINRIVSSLLP